MNGRMKMTWRAELLNAHSSDVTIFWGIDATLNRHWTASHIEVQPRLLFM